jgi:RecG-like helicase
VRIPLSALRDLSGVIADMRHRFGQWQRELLAADPS